MRSSRLSWLCCRHSCSHPLGLGPSWACLHRQRGCPHHMRTLIVIVVLGSSDGKVRFWTLVRTGLFRTEPKVQVQVHKISELNLKLGSMRSFLPELLPYMAIVQSWTSELNWTFSSGSEIWPNWTWSPVRSLEIFWKNWTELDFTITTCKIHLLYIHSWSVAISRYL